MLRPLLDDCCLSQAVVDCFRRHLLPLFSTPHDPVSFSRTSYKGVGTPFGEPSTHTQSHMAHPEGVRYIHRRWDLQGRRSVPARVRFSAVNPRTPSGCAPGCTSAGRVPSCRWSEAGVSGPRRHPGSPRGPGPCAETPASGSATCPTAAWPPPLPGSCSRGAEERGREGVTQGRPSREEGSSRAAEQRPPRFFKKKCTSTQRNRG